MTDKPNRCPYCWSSLPPAVDDVCPHCRKSLAVKGAKRRRQGQRDEVAAPPAAPPAPPPAASTPDEPYEDHEPSSPPASPDDASTLYQGYGPPTEPPAEWAPAPEPEAVAVLERDPVEFAGQPLPPNFFDALPERTRRPPGKHNRTILIVAVIAGSAILRAIGRS